MNADQVWSTLRSMLIAGGPVATLLVALGFPPVQVGTWTTIGLALVGVASIAYPLVAGIISHSDSAKIADVASLPPEKAAKAVASLPDSVRESVAISAVSDKAILAAANAMPDVSVITVNPAAANGIGEALADPTLEKIVAAPVEKK